MFSSKHNFWCSVFLRKIGNVVHRQCLGNVETMFVTRLFADAFFLKVEPEVISSQKMCFKTKQKQKMSDVSLTRCFAAPDRTFAFHLRNGRYDHVGNPDRATAAALVRVTIPDTWSRTCITDRQRKRSGS